MAREARPAEPSAGSLGPATLSIDVGGTGLKASVLDRDGRMLVDRVRVRTPYPCPPEVLVDSLLDIARHLPPHDRISVGFPGMVRGGRVLTAPNLVTEKGPGTKTSPALVAKWHGFDLAGELSKALGKPARIANDADIQGLGVVSGNGLELVITLGTGLGTAVFLDGRLSPHLELAHQPFRKGQTYNEQIGDPARRRIGNKLWSKRVAKAVQNFYVLLCFDTLYVGGGNARKLTVDLGPRATTVDNTAGILGGIRLWETEPT
jgi:polyphosphate glucokinase